MLSCLQGDGEMEKPQPDMEIISGRGGGAGYARKEKN